MKKLTKIKQRLLEYAQTQSITKEEFYQKIGIDGANFRGKNAFSDLGSDKIVSILTTFPDLNPDWLLLGKGSMLRKNTPNHATSLPDMPESFQNLPTDRVGIFVNHGGNGDTYHNHDNLLQLVIDQQRTIHCLTEQNRTLTEMISNNINQ